MHALTDRRTRERPAGTLSSLHSLLWLGLLLVLTGGLVGSVQAQDGVTTQNVKEAVEEGIPSSTWRTNFGTQAGRLLRQEGSPSTRTEILRSVIRFAKQTPRRVDLTGLMGPLLHVLKTESNPRHRLMAVQAVHSLGPEHAGEAYYRRALQRMYELTRNEASPRVRRAAAAGLNAYFQEE